MMLALASLTFAATLLLSPVAAQSAAPQDAARLLALSRHALGGAALERVKTLRLEGKVVAAGLTGTGTTWQDLLEPRYAESYELAPLRGAGGFDGRQAWTSDGSGLVWVDASEAGRASGIAQAFAQSGVLWRPDRGGARVSSLGVRTDKGVAYDVLQVEPPGTTVPFELWLDRRTHLPGRLTQTIGPDQTVTTLSRYRSVDGLMVPFDRNSTSTDGNGSQATVVRAIANPPEAAERLRKPASHVTDFSIAGSNQTTIPFDTVDNHVYLSVRLNGKGPYRFIFDTGGINIVDPAVAREIGAMGTGSAQVGGVGAKTESLAFANVDSLQIGDATVRKQLFAIVPTRAGFGVASGQPVDGLIGFEVLARFVTTFDYDNHRVILQMPYGMHPPVGSDVIPFVFDGRQPQFACTIAGVPAQCTLDTGSRSSISLMTPFLAAHPSIVPAGASAAGVNGFGVGGGSYGKLGRIANVQIGRYDVQNAIADFSSQTKGAFASPFVSANVGGGILKRFTVTLDYGKQTMALQQGRNFDTPDSYERAGIFVIAPGGRYVVYDVRAGTPAARAGLLKGDVIDAIDGVSTHDMSLQEVRDAFSRPSGTVVRFSITRKDGTKTTVPVTLTDYV